MTFIITTLTIMTIYAYYVNYELLVNYAECLLGEVVFCHQHLCRQDFLSPDILSPITVNVACHNVTSTSFQHRMALCHLLGSNVASTKNVIIASLLLCLL
jgi:hypothetical protein